MMRYSTSVCLTSLVIWAGFAHAGPPVCGNEPAAQLAEARRHWQKGRIDEALAAYDELADRFPVEAAVGRSRCFESRGEWDKAEALLREQSARDSKSAAVWIRLAEIELARGRFEQAAETAGRALAIDADAAAARLVQADVLAATGKLKEADEAYRWFIRFYNRKQPTDADTLLIVARGAAQYARWHSAAQIFDFVVNTLCPDALAQDEGAWQSHFIAGSLLLEKYNRPEALTEFRKALAINPRAADVLVALAEAALQSQDIAEAEKFAQRASEINRGCVRALQILADLKSDAGDVPAARELLERALKINPHAETTLARAAICDLAEDGIPEPAELQALFARLDDRDNASEPPASRFAQRTLAVAQRNPHPGVYLNLVGERLEARRQFLPAERLYRQAAKMMPQFSEPKTNLGLLSMRVGKIDEARTLLDQAFRADQYHVRVSNMRKVLKLLDGYESVAGDHFVLRVDSQADRILAKYALEFLEDEYPALVEQYGFEPPTRTQFEIYNKAKGLSAHQWFSARMVGVPWIQTIGASTGMIVALTSPTASNKPFNWARVLKHEFVHILTLQKTNFNIPHWFTEALAVTAEGYPRPAEWDELLLERVPRGEVMNLDNINLGFQRPKSPDDWQMAYCQSYLYVAYMIEKLGPSTPRKLLDAYQQSPSTERAISLVFGVEKEEFEQGYREFLNRLVARLRALAPEEASKPAEIEKAYRDNPDDPAAAGRFAALLLKLGKRSAARDIAERVNGKHPAAPLAAVTLAALELDGEDLRSAAKLLEPALDNQQPHPQVLELLAKIRLNQGNAPAAAELYELGLQFQPTHKDWLRGLAAARLKLGAREPLREVLVRLSEVDADDVSVRRKLAEMAIADESWADAVRYARLALHIDVMDPAIHRLLARGYTGLGQHARSAAEWAVALELAPDDAETITELARSEAAAGDRSAAVKRLRELLKTQDDYAPAQKLLRELMGD
jgi:cellulose synthase operon protein C